MNPGFNQRKAGLYKTTKGHIDIYLVLFFLRVSIFFADDTRIRTNEDLEAYVTYRYYYTRFAHTRYYAVGSQ